MESVNAVIKNVLDSFFDVGEQDGIVQLNSDDTQLVANAIEEGLKKKGVI